MPGDDSAHDSTARPRAASARLFDTIDGFLADPGSAEAALAQAERLPTEVQTQADAVLSDKRLSYRDGLLIQLAFGLGEVAEFDHTKRPEGARSEAAKIGTGFKERYIPAVSDAYQNIGKNTDNLARGNMPAFDSLLQWMNTAPVSDRHALLSYLLSRIAQTARTVKRMPELRVSALTFEAVATLLDRLLATPSGGAYQQFAVAAFLEALIYEFGLGGVGGLSVKTKNINASDASSGATADVQIMRANKIEEAFEVSANEWSTKLGQAVQAAANADLARVHVIAAYSPDDDHTPLTGLAADVTVNDIRAFVRVMVSLLKKPSREFALRRLHELLDRNQPDVKRTNAYVDLLASAGVTSA